MAAPKPIICINQKLWAFRVTFWGGLHRRRRRAAAPFRVHNEKPRIIDKTESWCYLRILRRRIIEISKLFPTETNLPGISNRLAVHF